MQAPAELIREILSRLPVKSLLRFRCVSKGFRSEIDSPDFIKYHHAQSSKNNTNLSVLITHRYKDAILSLDFDSLENPVRRKNLFKKDVTPVCWFPRNPFKNNTHLDIRFWFRIGFCKGLLALVSRSGIIGLFNTATRKHLLLPRLELPVGHAYVVYGFGYDPCGDDYKVIVLSYFKNPVVEAMVYCLKEKVWRKVKGNCPYRLYAVGHSAPCVSGKIHFTNISRNRRVNVVVGFDLSTEKYIQVPLPDSLLPYSITANLTELGGCLCAVARNGPPHGDIWVMKDYGVKESWTKILSVKPPEPEGDFFPVAYSPNRERLLLRLCGPLTDSEPRQRLYWYHMKDKTIQKFRETFLPKAFFADVITECLVNFT